MSARKPVTILHKRFMKVLINPIFILLTATLFSLDVFAGDTGVSWKPITPAELAMKEPSVEKEADAEAIFWEVWLDDKKSNRLSYDHYVRVKIFTERGREKFSKLDIPFYKGRKVENIAARVIKPDGTIVDLQLSDIFEREIVKAGKVKINAKSFAVPGIEPGVIVEYRYSEIVKNDSLNGESLVFQRDIPMQTARYYVRPYKGANLNFKYRNMPEMRFRENAEGFYVGTLTNIPAIKDEPRMPPEDEVRYWVSLSYNTFGFSFNWRFFGFNAGAYLKAVTKPTKEIKQKAAELTGGISSPEEQLRRIYEFSQKNVRNASYDRSFNEEQIDKLKIKDADDVLKRGIGTAGHVDLLFAALAKASGFDVALVFAGNRSENFFNPSDYNGGSYVHPVGIGVILDQKWKVFNPGTPYMPFGRIDWFEEDVSAMIAEETSFNWTKIKSSGHSESPARRTADLTLQEDGTIHGLIRLEYEGHQAISRRRAGYRDSANKREEEIKEEIKVNLKNAEITDISIENFESADKPLTYIFKIRVPNYAQRTGKRMFFQPGFFEYGTTPIFSAAQRKYGIYFAYPWLETDKVSIKYPEGFEIEGLETPGPLADPNKIGSLNLFISVDKASRTVLLKREFYFGSEGRILFPATSYHPLKNLFDAFHKADTHNLALLQQ